MLTGTSRLLVADILAAASFPLTAASTVPVAESLPLGLARSVDLAQVFALASSTGLTSHEHDHCLPRVCVLETMIPLHVLLEISIALVALVATRIRALELAVVEMRLHVVHANRRILRSVCNEQVSAGTSRMRNEN